MSDPADIFARLREVEIPAALLEQVSAGVSAELDRERRSSWMRPALAWAAAAALAVALLVPAALRPHPAVPLAATEAPRAGIESLRTRGPAQVLDLTVGDTQVVMIFDAELSL